MIYIAKGDIQRVTSIYSSPQHSSYIPTTSTNSDHLYMTSYNDFISAPTPHALVIAMDVSDALVIHTSILCSPTSN